MRLSVNSRSVKPGATVYSRSNANYIKLFYVINLSYCQSFDGTEYITQDQISGVRRHEAYLKLYELPGF